MKRPARSLGRTAVQYPRSLGGRVVRGKAVTIAFAAVTLTPAALTAQEGAFEGHGGSEEPARAEPTDGSEELSRAEPIHSENSAASLLFAPPPEPASKPLPVVMPLFDHAPGSTSRVRNLVGQVGGELLKCQEQSKYGPDERHVRVHIDRVPVGGLTAHGDVVDALLLRGAKYVWRACPRQYMFLNKPKNDFYYDIGTVEIVGPRGEPLFQAQLGGEFLTGFGDQPLGSSHKGYKWQYVRDLAAEQEVADEAARQREAAEQARLARQAADNEAARQRGNSFMFWAFVILLLWGGGWVLSKYETIAEWFYGLQPHPATGLVDAAIYDSQPIDGILYEEVHRPQFSNPIENAVREQQANELTRRLRSHEATLRAEAVWQMKQVREQAERDNAFLRAHAELLRAGVDHEVAAARLDELRKATNERRRS